MNNDLLEFGVTTRYCPSATRISYTSPWGMVVEHTAITGSTLAMSGTSAPWVLDAAKKLEAIGKLPAGWDSHGGLTLDPNARKLTASVLGWLGNDNLPVPAVVLGSGGTVQLEWRAKGKELEIELGNDNTIEFVMVNPGGEIEEGHQNVGLPQKLRGLTWWLMSE
jgi:hypothetical protein